MSVSVVYEFTTLEEAERFRDQVHSTGPKGVVLDPASSYGRTQFHYGYAPATDTLLLWRNSVLSKQRNIVQEIDWQSAITLTNTVVHIATLKEKKQDERTPGDQRSHLRKGETEAEYQARIQERDRLV